MKNGCNLACVSNEQIVVRLREALGGEREQLAEFLRVLAEIDTRKLYVDLGYTSLFVYCVEALNLSHDQAYRRVATARAGQRFPVILRMIAAGEIHMTGVAKLSKYLTPANHSELLEKSRRKSKAEIELLIATMFPQEEEKKATIRRLSGSGGSASRSKSTRRKAEVSPVSGTSYSVRFTASARAKGLLDKAKDLLAHRKPNIDVDEILELALEGLVETLEKKRWAKTDRPRKSSSRGDEEVAKPGDRYVPAAVKRAVYERDGGRCSYISADGTRCSCTYGLELDHVHPVALGGASTFENLRLRCRAHNIHAAEQIFGRATMEQWARRLETSLAAVGPGQVEGRPGG